MVDTGFDVPEAKLTALSIYQPERRRSGMSDAAEAVSGRRPASFPPRPLSAILPDAYE